MLTDTGKGNNKMFKCNSILQQGIFDETLISTNRSVSETLFEWLKSASFSDVKSKIDSGLKIGLPIKGIPVEIGGSFSEDDFKNWKHEVESSNARLFTEQEARFILRRSASDEIVRAWLECIIGTVAKVGLNSDLIPTEGSENLVFTVRYIPDDIDDPYPVVLRNGFQVTGARAVAPLADGSEIPFAGISTLLIREGLSAVTVVVNTSRGTTNQSSPPVEPPRSPLADLIDRIKLIHEFTVSFDKVVTNFDSGWTGSWKTDPMGTLKVGETYHVTFMEGRFTTRGVNEGTGKEQIATYDNANLDNGEISLWGRVYKFDENGNIYDRDYGLVGTLRV
jgi:hypothetical protein